MKLQTTVGIQRLENAVIAVLLLGSMVLANLPWWVLLASFLFFDVSALGYLRGPRIGAFYYNLVHNYLPAGVLALGYLILKLAEMEVSWLLILAASWAFHVAVDRALGYGLKLQGFQHTHLGVIGGNDK